MVYKKLKVLAFLLMLTSANVSFAEESYPVTVVPSAENLHYLNYDEIHFLSTHDAPNTEFQKRYEKLLNTLIAQKNIHQGSLKTDSKTSKKYFRVTHWNIDRGYNMDRIAKMYKNSDSFIENDLKEDTDKENIERVKKDIEILKETDIFLLNEVDIGLPRTQYKNVVEEFAKLVGGNYAYAVEFIEADPKILSAPDLDKNRYKGLHGNAVVSKFPIKNARVVRLPDYYHWYDAENHTIGPVEKIRRKGAKVIFDETVITELRHGSRVAIIADIQLPNNEVVTVVSTHLENRTMARFRERQLKALLEAIKDIKTPIVLGGDFNNFENSGEPTSAKKIVVRTVGDPQTVARIVGGVFTPYSYIISPGLYLTSFARKYRNPTVISVPVLMRNRNYELFDIVNDFEFNDKNKFDFSGSKEYTYNGRGGNLANSNERSGFKGFVSTYRFNRDLWLAIFKIDWIFVKPIVDTTNTACVDKKISKVYKDYDCKRYFPVYPKTLKWLNRQPKDGLFSDHNPVSVGIMI